MANTAAEHLAHAENLIAQLDADNRTHQLSRELQASIAGLHIAAANCATNIRATNTKQNLAEFILTGEPDTGTDGNPWPPARKQ